MSEQAVDLRSTLAVLRRHRAALAGAALVGTLAGAGLVTVRPPLYVSTSQVLLPQLQSNNGQVPTRDVQTDVQIAQSEAVLGPAGKAMTPRIGARGMQRRVTVAATTDDVLQFAARSKTPSVARALAHQVAASEMRYIKDAASSVDAAQQNALETRQQALKTSLATVSAEIKKTTARQSSESASSAQGRSDASALAQLTAQQADLVLQIDQVEERKAGSQSAGSTPSTASLIQAASPARRAGLLGRYAVSAGVGLFGGILLAGVLLAIFGRRDRRLRFRDEIADALGSTVTASVRSRPTRTVAGWTSLLENYEPATVDAWALRQALRQLASGDGILSHRRSSPGDGGGSSTITVITLSDDAAGLAMGPQLASYAASAGVRTRLVTAQRHESAAALWAACHRGRGQEEVRPGLFVETTTEALHDVDLTVVLAVVDRSKPLLSTLPLSTTVLAVSSGSATAEELARVAVTADDADARIAGLIVADPDDLDRTTGRLLQNERAQEVSLPTRLTGMSAPPSSSGAAAAGLRRSPG